ncbi:MAG: ice-binding family protein, partial [Actinomycetota bacterium]|nr:ice-binding family protein [Actinomycetota bacterium]
PQAKNIFWQVAGSDATLGTTAHVEGVILTAGYITLNAGATANSRLLAQTAVTLDGTVTQPAP